MAASIDGFAVLKTIGENREQFTLIRDEVNTQASSLIKRIIGLSTLDQCRALYRLLDPGDIKKALNSGKPGPVLKKLDKHANLKGRSETDNRAHLFSLISAELEPKRDLKSFTKDLKDVTLEVARSQAKSILPDDLKVAIESIAKGPIDAILKNLDPHLDKNIPSLDEKRRRVFNLVTGDAEPIQKRLMELESMGPKQDLKSFTSNLKTVSLAAARSQVRNISPVDLDVVIEGKSKKEIDPILKNLDPHFDKKASTLGNNRKRVLDLLLGKIEPIEDKNRRT
jgi:hypothetical protein